MLREFMEFSKFLSGNERRYLHSGAKFCPVNYEINLSQVQYIYNYVYIYVYVYIRNLYFQTNLYLYSQITGHCFATYSKYIPITHRMVGFVSHVCW
jgi:hypothetical protein